MPFMLIRDSPPERRIGTLVSHPPGTLGLPLPMSSLSLMLIVLLSMVFVAPILRESRPTGRWSYTRFDNPTQRRDTPLYFFPSGREDRGLVGRAA